MKINFFQTWLKGGGHGLFERIISLVVQLRQGIQLNRVQQRIYR